MKPTLDQQIDALQARIDGLKPRSEERAYLTRQLVQLKCKRMRRDLKIRHKRRAVKCIAA